MKQGLSWIGNTPMYQIPNTSIYVKLEKFNLTGSIKDRAVFYMYQQAKKENKFTKDTILIEASSGNTGISLAMIGAMFHHPVWIVMPSSVSEERRALIQAYGAKLILSDGAFGMQGAIDQMYKIMKENDCFLHLNQFDNAANGMAHYQTTAKEILQQVPNVEIFVSCGGSGGTFSGISRRLKEHNPNIHCVYGEPKYCAVVSKHPIAQHQIQGIGPNFIPANLQLDLMDDILLISDEDAIQEMKTFVRQTGILVGISSGANLALAKRLSKYYPNKTIVTIAPDGGERYLSMWDRL